MDKIHFREKFKTICGRTQKRARDKRPKRNQTQREPTAQQKKNTNTLK